MFLDLYKSYKITFRASLFIFASFALSTISLPSFASDQFNISRILLESTVRINVWENRGTDEASVVYGGSGVVINNVGKKIFILTNAHVLLDEYCSPSSKNDCESNLYPDNHIIVIDTSDSKYEYIVEEDDFIFWEDIDLGVVVIDMSNFEEYDDMLPIKISGKWYPLMEVFSSGYPLVLGNQSNYRKMFFTSGVINSLIDSDQGLADLENYSIVHNSGITGGMSGGPLVDNNGMLLGINGLVGAPELEQGFLGAIVDFDFDNFNYSYAIHIYDFYNAVITTDSGNFDSNSKFFGFLPRLSKSEHLALYNYFIDEHPIRTLAIFD